METKPSGFISGGDVSYVPTSKPETHSARQTRFSLRRAKHGSFAAGTLTGLSITAV